MSSLLMTIQKGSRERSENVGTEQGEKGIDKGRINT